MILDKQKSGRSKTNPALSYPGDGSDPRTNRLVRRLSESGHRITVQRLCILKALVETDKHPSAEEVYAQVQMVCPTTSRGTVYKTLRTLKDMGELVELEFRDAPSRYDARRPDEHPHAVCTRCGRIEDLELGGLSELNDRAGQASGFQIVAHRLDFYGLCRLCREP